MFCFSNLEIMFIAILEKGSKCRILGYFGEEVRSEKWAITFQCKWSRGPRHYRQVKTCCQPLIPYKKNNILFIRIILCNHLSQWKYISQQINQLKYLLDVKISLGRAIQEKVDVNSFVFNSSSENQFWIEEFIK